MRPCLTKCMPSAECIYASNGYLLEIMYHVFHDEKTIYNNRYIKQIGTYIYNKNKIKTLIIISSLFSKST